MFGLALRIRHDPLKDFEHRVRLNVQPGLLGHFATDSLFQLFARFDDSSRDGPVSLQRLLSTLHQQNLSILKNQRTYAQERARRIAPAVLVRASRINTRSLSRPNAPDKPKSAP